LEKKRFRDRTTRKVEEQEEDSETNIPKRKKRMKRQERFTDEMKDEKAGHEALFLDEITDEYERI
jgi:hypothetical protein